MTFAPTIILVVLLLHLVASEASWQAAKRTVRGARYPGGLILRVAARLGPLFILYVLYFVAVPPINDYETQLRIVCTPLIMLIALIEPREIRTNRDGATQLGFFGIGRKFLRWEGAAASYIPALGEVRLIGSNGTTIVHTRYHVDQSAFLSELRSHKVYFHGSGLN